MSKAHRGKGIRKTLTLSRSECPKCGRSGVKLIYQVNEGDAQLNVCKPCFATANKKS